MKVEGPVYGAFTLIDGVQMSYKIIESKNSWDELSLRKTFALDVLMGLSSEKKFLSSKYFYDKNGSELFAKITDEQDYYPTDCEFDIFKTHKTEIAHFLKGDSFNLIELGAGDGRKTKILLEEFINQKLDFEYVPVDISESAVANLSENLAKDFPDLVTNGLVGEYMSSLEWLKNNSNRKNVILFLGSNIGNFSMTQSMVFLRTVWANLNHKDVMLIGFDLKKDIDVLLRAYNDSAGVTAAFNLNLLNRINRELGGNFNLNKFQHFGTFHPGHGAMESYLVSLADQRVYIKELEKEFSFKAFEAVHTEYSYKYLQKDIEFLAKETGFNIRFNFNDSKKYYIDSLWEVQK
jgi:dimethylhistidine N-methyltransferase